MSLINDESYTQFSVKVFGINLAHLPLKHNQNCRFVKFRILKPTLPILDGISSLYNKQYKNMNIAVNFLSILGFESLKLSNVELNQQIQNL